MDGVRRAAPPPDPSPPDPPRPRGRRTGPPPPRSSLTRLTAAVLLLVAAPPGGLSAKDRLPDRGSGGDAPLAPELAPVDPAELDRRAAGLHALDQLLPRDRAADRLLQQARRDAAAGRLPDAVDALQTLFERPDDLFTRPTDTSAPRSLRGEAEDLLHADAALLAAYRGRFAPESDALLSAGDAEAARELLWRYPASEAAERLRVRRLRTALDAGRLRTARRIRDDLLRRPQSLGDAAFKLATAVPQSRGTGAEPTRTASLGPIILTAATRPQSATPTPLLTVEWSAALDESCPDDVREAVATWRTGDSAEGLGARTVLLRGETLLVRDFAGLTARRVSDGRLLWRRATAGDLRSVPDNQSVRGHLDRAILHDSAAGELAADADRVYFVERDGDAARLRAVRLCDGADVWRTPPGRHVLGSGEVTPRGLLLLEESGREVRLTLLEAATGRQRWSQPVAVPSVAASCDGPRPLIAARPVAAGGTAVCATQLGVLVAADLETGSLRWVHRDAELTAGPGGRPRTTSARSPHPPAVPGRPLVHGGVVYAMSPQSAEIAAVSLHEGRVLWRLPRESAQTLARPCGGTLLVVGKRFVRGLNAADGSERYRLRTPPLRGRPAVVGTTLWLPTEAGRTVAVDAAEGRVLDGSWQRLAAGRQSGEESGNLLATDDWLIACGPTRLTVYPTCEAARRSAAEELAKNPADAKARLRLARVDLAAGDPVAALDHLRPLRRSDVPAGTLTAYEHVLRESLFGAVAGRQAEDPAESFDRLRRLAETVPQSARVLICRAESELAAGRPEHAVRAAADAIRLCEGRGRVDIVLDRYRVRADVLARRLIGRAVREGGVEVAGDATLGPLLRAATTRAGRERFLAAVESTGEADAVRLALAADLIGAGEFQAAELHALRVLRGDRGPATGDDLRADAARLLAGLYERCGRPKEAADLRRLGGLDAPAPPAASGPVYEASIAVRAGEPPAWAALYADTRPKVSAAPGCGFEVLDLGTLADRPDRAELAVLGRTGGAAARFDVPAHYWHPTSRPHASCGHLLPLGASRTEAASLLEARSLWTAADGETRTRGKVGLVTPAVTVVQHAGRLLGLDSLTGRTLWERSDLSPRSGLWYDESGLFGDADLFTVVEEDGNGYAVYETATGRRTGGGTLVPPGRRVLRGSRVAGGRRLAFVASDPAAPAASRYRWTLLDPRDGSSRTLAESARFTLDRLPAAGLFGAGRASVAALDASGRFLLLDVGEGRLRVDEASLIDPADVTGLNVLERGGLLVVDVCRAAASGQSVPSSASLRAAARAVGGELTVLRPDGRGGAEPVWRADLGRGAVLHADAGESVLLHLCRLRSPRAGRDRTALSVVRLRDGRTLARDEGLPRTAWLRLEASEDRRTLTLVGATHAAEVRLTGANR